MQDTTTSADRAAVAACWTRCGGRPPALTAPEGKLVCDAYGIPVPKEGAGHLGRRGGASSPQRWAFPSSLKIVSPDILHKTEAGGVLRRPRVRR